MARALTYTAMVEFIQAPGTITECMAMENSPGRTEAHTKVTMTKTFDRARVCTGGLTAGATREALRMENSTVKDDSTNRDTSQRPGFGATGN